MLNTSCYSSDLILVTQMSHYSAQRQLVLCTMKFSGTSDGSVNAWGIQTHLCLNHSVSLQTHRAHQVRDVELPKQTAS